MQKNKYFIETLPDCMTKGRPYEIIQDVPMAKVPYTIYYKVNPTDIACQAIMGDEKALEWLLYFQSRDGTWKHYYDDVFYGTKSPWVSGLSQALAASALIRNGYTKEANLAMVGLYDNSYYEGFVTEKPGVIVINAWIFALFAIKDMCDAGEYYQWMGEPVLEKIKAYLKSGKATLKNGWSRYDHTGILSTPFYHKLLVEQLEALDNMYLSDTIGLAFEKMRFAKYPKYKRTVQLLVKNNIKTPYIYWKRRKWLK